MKKMIAFIFLILVGLTLMHFKTFPSLDFEKVVVVSENADIDIEDKVKNGNDFYYTISKEMGSISKFFKKDDIKGLIFYISPKYSLEKLKKRFDFIFESSEEIDNQKIYYGYDSSYPDFRFIKNKKVNFQLTKNDENWILGYPMILTGF